MLRVHGWDQAEKATLRQSLLSWYDSHRRKLPWRGDAPPYTSAASTKAQTQAKAPPPRGQSSITRFFRRREPVPAPVPAPAVLEIPVVNEERAREDVKTSAVEPYQVWVSEVMLQQTRVETVIEYYEKWMKQFPTVRDLAQASLEEVNQVWAGLGYYRRARMLWLGAQKVCDEMNGKLPDNVDELLTIPGIGAYTAGAIASIAFGKPVPLVDGNVIRVFSRLRAIDAPPDHKPAVKLHWELAREAVDPARPRDFNQALMELGACICTIRNPQCGSCPVRSICWANQLSRKDSESTYEKETRHEILENHDCEVCLEPVVKNLVEVTDFPRKKVKKSQREEHICACVVVCCGRILFTKRADKGLLAGQWEFPNVQVEEDYDDEARVEALKARMEPILNSLPGHLVERRSLDL